MTHAKEKKGDNSLLFQFSDESLELPLPLNWKRSYISNFIANFRHRVVTRDTLVFLIRFQSVLCGIHGNLYVYYIIILPESNMASVRLPL